MTPVKHILLHVTLQIDVAIQDIKEPQDAHNNLRRIQPLNFRFALLDPFYFISELMDFKICTCQIVYIHMSTTPIHHRRRLHHHFA